MYAYHTGFLYDGGIKAVWKTFNSTIPPNIKPDPIALSPHYNKWEGYVGGAAAARAVPHDAALVHVQHARRCSPTAGTCGVAVVAAFFVLLLMLNWYLALLATVCILLVMSGVIAIVMLLGQSLGMYECLVMILAIGLAVDYDVHLTHFYNEAKGTRREKAIEALSSVGISIVGGACTTMGAGLPLFFTAMTFFKLCGWFIFFTSLCSIVQSFFLLMPMLMILGPEGTRGTSRGSPARPRRRGGRGDGFSSDVKGGRGRVMIGRPLGAATCWWRRDGGVGGCRRGSGKGGEGRGRRAARRGRQSTGHMEGCRLASTGRRVGRGELRVCAFRHTTIPGGMLARGECIMEQGGVLGIMETLKRPVRCCGVWDKWRAVGAVATRGRGCTARRPLFCCLGGRDKTPLSPVYSNEKRSGVRDHMTHQPWAALQFTEACKQG